MLLATTHTLVSRKNGGYLTEGALRAQRPATTAKLADLSRISRKRDISRIAWDNARKAR